MCFWNLIYDMIEFFKALKESQLELPNQQLKKSLNLDNTFKMAFIDPESKNDKEINTYDITPVYLDTHPF